MKRPAVRRLVRAHLTHGHYQGAGCVYARCPLCRDDVTGYHVAWASAKERQEALSDALVLHILDEHPDSDGPK